ncbi:MAG: family 10 glycosylhydrolase [Candidatus Cloacimonadota bacterium]|nr:family 10 glycosylhydrolase [Candidatus Cloacimonadota bacterium]
MNKNILVFVIALLVLFFVQNNKLHSFAANGLWVPSWELNSPEKIKKVVRFAVENDFKHIFAEIRYRGDALYVPNKTDSTFSNPEKRSYFLDKQPESFDPLYSLIQLAHDYHIQVFAWLTTFVITPKNTIRLPDSHVVFQHPEWITYNENLEKMDIEQVGSGLFLDPGIKEVQEYTQNIILDIAKNYLIDGVMLDYIRYPGSEFGYNPISLANFSKNSTSIDSAKFVFWKQAQLTNFVKDTGQKLKNVKKSMIFATTGIGEYAKAKNQFCQDWMKWLDFDSLDYVYLMLYAKSDEEFTKQIESIPNNVDKKRIGISLRAWNHSNNYPVQQIFSKVSICEKNNFKVVSLFHFGGIRENEFTIQNKIIKY